MPRDYTNNLPVAIQHRESIIEQVAQGIKLSVIAKELGISRQAISQHLTLDPEYQSARVSGLAERLDKREEELEASSDMLTLARNKELLSHARWKCEREAPQYWGNNKGVQVNTSEDGKVSITIIDNY